MGPADSKQFAFDSCIPMEERLRFGHETGGLDAMRKQVQGKYDKFHHAAHTTKNGAASEHFFIPIDYEILVMAIIADISGSPMLLII